MTKPEIDYGQNPGKKRYYPITKIRETFGNIEEMPNSKSATKRLRQSKVRRDHNKSIKTAVKTQIKKVLAAVQSGDVAAAEDQYKLAAKRLDKAGAKNVIHSNAAARQKSRMQRAIKTAKSPSG